VNQLIFFAGAPGSRWSGVSQVFRDTLPNIDNSDLTSDRTYSHPVYSGHVGNYYGPGMQFGQWLEHTIGTPAQWKEEIEKSYSNNSNTKLILSHHFCYRLDELAATFPNSYVVLCYREDQDCYDWWHEAGGWNITHPDYSWYDNNEKMFSEITAQNAGILEFVDKHDLELQAPDLNFFRTHFGVDRDFEFGKEVKVAVYKEHR